MNRIYFLFVGLLLFSCSKPLTIEDLAKECAENYCRNNNIDGIEVSNIETETKYKNDSLCIIETIYDIKIEDADKRKDTTEYVYLLHSNVAYEAIRSKDFDDIEFFSKKEFDKRKIGEIFETLSYDDAMYYLAATLINEHGRKVDNHDKDVNITTLFGNWKLYHFEDEFGDKTPPRYIGVKGKGIVEIDANKNMDMTVYLFIRNGEVFFKFYVEDMHFECADNSPLIINIKDSDGETYKYDFVIQENGEIVLNANNEKRQSIEQLISIIGKEGIMSGTAQRYSTQYKFKIDLSGYREVFKRL